MIEVLLVIAVAVSATLLYLLKKDDALRSFPVIWDKMCNEHWGILEGVEKYLFFLARTKVPDILPIIEKNSNFKNMYWNNVWNLEDKDITDKDISLWREQFDCKGRYRRNLIKYLLVRRNKNYFKRVTIDLLFEFMDGIADKPGEFDDFIKTFFPITKFDRFNQEIDQKECVFPCNHMVKALTEGLNNHIGEIDYYTFLKLSIYLYGLMPKEIKHLWIMASSCCAKVIETITNEYLHAYMKDHKDPNGVYENINVHLDNGNKAEILNYMLHSKVKTFEYSPFDYWNYDEIMNFIDYYLKRM